MKYLYAATGYSQCTELWNHFEWKFCLFPILKDIYTRQLRVKTKQVSRTVGISDTLKSKQARAFLDPLLNTLADNNHMI